MWMKDIYIETDDIAPPESTANFTVLQSLKANPRDKDGNEQPIDIIHKDVADQLKRVT